MSGPEAFKAELSTKITVDVIRAAKYVAIVGSREYPEPERVKALVALLHEEATVVSGGARGVDRAADTAALNRGLMVAEVSGRGGIPALFARNTVIVRGSDVVVAFWDGKSNGTRDSIEKALTMHGFCVVALPGEPPVVWERSVVPKK